MTTATKFSRWRIVLNTYCGRAFKKIRVRPKKLVNNSVKKLIDSRNHLKRMVESKPNYKIQREIDIIDAEISEILHNKAKSHAYKFRKFCDMSSSFPVHQMWKKKKNGLQEKAA